MPDDPRVQQLLDALLDSDATPEEVCGACVELLPVVRDRWRQMCQARAELDALFPPAAAPGTSLPAPTMQGEALPAVPGYEVEAVLGRGGMGVVFRARHLRLNRVVALKMGLAGAYAGPHERERFHREAQAVAALQHPNVVQVHDVGEAESRPYFAMEYVEGGSLAQKLAGTPLPAREAAVLLATLAGAVEAAHRAGIVHRDLKPANVLLTADGAAKISDFGLARRLTGEAGLTRTGTAVGTPSYMAPEQARGERGAAGPAVDVYALGAMLYECLTGRPPFRAETGMATIGQVLSQDPVPPSRLNAKTPRDLETVCLKCLLKEPRLRYASAAALADDLGCFLRGESIAARPEGWPARLIRQIRRRPALSASVAVCTLLAVALVGGGAWTLADRQATARAAQAEKAATEQTAADDLKEMVGWLRKSSWPEARAALERAKGRLGDRGADPLRGLLRQGDHDLKLADRLEEIGLAAAASVDGFFQFTRSDQDYEAAFRAFGQFHENPEAVADRVAASNVWRTLVDALDHWVSRTTDPGRQNWLLRVAQETVKRQADPDPTGWRKRARDPDVLNDKAAFDRLIKDARFTEPSVALLLALAQRLRDEQKNPIPFLRQVQRAHPGDFWANFILGNLLRSTRDYPESLRYLQAALAIRPAALAHAQVGIALFELGRIDEAVEHYRLALKADPMPVIRKHLAQALSLRGPADEAVEQCRLALADFPDDAKLHTAWGTALERSRRYDEAALHFQQAVKKDPNRANALIGLRNAFVRQGRSEEALAAWGKALNTRPPLDHPFFYGYAECCLYLAKKEEYRRARKALLDRFGSTGDPLVAERVGRACLLLPASGDELHQAVALADRALAADRGRYGPVLPHFRFVKGLADYRQGRCEQAIAAMRGDASRMLGPAPRLVLAMALHQTGRTAEARRTLAEAVVAYDWRASRVRDQDGFICHVLRREAEGMVLTNLPPFLAGKHQPEDNDERLALLGVCQFAGRTHTVARLYADAFAAAPQLAEDFRFGHRHNAACFAAQAGCGRGVDAPGVGERERTKWRARAREWLRADLVAWSKVLKAQPAATRDLLRQRLLLWQTEPDLACLREPMDLDRLPADERKDCLSLWAEVAAELGRCGKAP